MTSRLNAALLIGAYGFMVLSQTCGLGIIQFLHGPEARADAQAAPKISPYTEVQDLCFEYEQAHFDRVSNILHSIGMVATGELILIAILFPIWRLLLWTPPVYYLLAWVGRFLFQKGVPAVFSYATTPRGWATGEFCSIQALLTGKAIDTFQDWFLTIIATLPLVYALFLATTSQSGRVIEKSKPL